MFVAPGPIEEALVTSEHIRQIFVWGDGYMSAVAAVVVIIPLKGSHSESETETETETEQRVIASLREVGRGFGLKAWEVPTRVKIVREAFTQDNGLLR